MDSFEPPCVVVVVILCYLFTIPIACVLVRYYPHCHCLACGKLVVHHIVVRLPLLGTHHHHLPLMVLLIVCHVVVGGVSALCCLHHCELLPTSIAFSWWSSFVIGNKRKEKKKSLHLSI
jgi:hypothetical protein